MQQVTNEVAAVVAAPGGYFEPLLNDVDAARLLGGIGVKKLQQMARNGQVPAHRIGKPWFFRASELDVWLKSAKVC